MMMSRTYRIAGIIFQVNLLGCDWFEDDGILSDYRIESNEFDHSLSFEIVEELSLPEGECVFSDPSKRVYLNGKMMIRYDGSVKQSLSAAYLRIACEGNHSHVEVKKSSIPHGITPKLIMQAMEMEHQIVKKNGILFHSSYIRIKDEAVLFTAPSGTGKSTQADLWVKYRNAELLNGDRSAVLLEEDGVFVHGIPFSGSSSVRKNVKLPLRAIVYLAQAKQTRIERLKGAKAFRCIWEGCSVNVWHGGDIELCSRTVSELAMRIPVYYLPCTPDETAVLALEKELGGLHDAEKKN